MPYRIMNILSHAPALGFLLIATTLEVSGDAVVRMAMLNHVGMARVGLMIAGALLLFGYGFALNLAPLQFGQVAGLYIATLFLVWQAINFIAFKAIPNLPIIVGGGLIIAGGLIVTFWKPGLPS
jgi:small multidrug resistance family-3 protein